MKNLAQRQRIVGELDRINKVEAMMAEGKTDAEISKKLGIAPFMFAVVKKSIEAGKKEQLVEELEKIEADLKTVNAISRMKAEELSDSDIATELKISESTVTRVVTKLKSDDTNPFGHKNGITVGDLRELIKDLDDDAYILIPAGKDNEHLCYVADMRYVRNTKTNECGLALNYEEPEYKNVETLEIIIG